jgi:hypothetical protein
MSVCAFISNPINNSEEGLNIPFASELFLKKTWLYGSQELDLEWIPLFLNGIDITKKDLPLIIEEIEKLKIWAKQKLSQEDCENIEKRINFIKEELPKFFLREDALVFIG